MSISLRFGSVLRLLVLAIAGVSVWGYWQLEAPHDYIDSKGMVLILAFSAALFLFSGRFSTKFPESMYITPLLILFLQSRLCVLIYIPDSLLHHGRVTSEQLNPTLLFIILGTIACYFGCALGHLRLVRFKRPEEWQLYGPKLFRFTFLAFFVSVAFTMWVYLNLGFAGSTGSGAHMGFFQRYLARLVAPGNWLIVLLAIYLLRERRSTQLRLLIGAVIVYVLMRILQGSRGGVFEILTLLIAGKVLVDGNFFITIKVRQLIFLLLAPPLALLTFQIPTQLRNNWYDSSFSLSNYFIDIVTGNGEPLIDEQTVSNISYRLSFLEPTMFPMYGEDLGLNEVSALVNVRTTALSSANRLIPGKPFGDILFTEYAFGFIYEEFDGVLAYSSDGRVDRVGYEWTMYGISYQLFGKIGGVIFIFLATAFLVQIIRFFLEWRNLYGVAFGIFWASILIVWIRNLGLDNLIDRAAHGFVIVIFYAVICWAVQQKNGMLQPAAPHPNKL